MGKFLDKKEIEKLKVKYPKGSRVEAVCEGSSPLKNVKSGDVGTVLFVDDAGGIHVSWDKWGELTLLHGAKGCILLEEISRK